jgi:hypothetical protein
VRTFLLTVLAVAGLSLVLPLFLWGATGHFRRSFGAWLSWWKIMAGIVAVGGLFGLLAMLAERV